MKNIHYAVAFTNATVWAGLFAFVAVFSTWCIQFIGNEMEMPFGDNADDLDLASAQNEFNRAIYSNSAENFNRPTNREGSSDLDENLTESIAATQTLI